MNDKIIEIKQGTVTSPNGFLAGAVEADIKYKGRLDVGVLYSDSHRSWHAVLSKSYKSVTYSGRIL